MALCSSWTEASPPCDLIRRYVAVMVDATATWDWRKMSTRSFTPVQLRTTSENILRALGTPDHFCREVAESLIAAQLAGHDSHGLIRLTEYASFVERGTVQPAARPEIVSNAGATAVVDGNWGWGQPACHLAVSTAEHIAREHGVAAVTVRHCNHIGRIGEYVESLAAAGLVGLAWCNADPAVAPYGGKARLLGTNPIAAGIPLGEDQPPLVMDFATAATAEGKLRLARAAGAQIDPGLVIDQDGRPGTTAEAFYSGGALLPFGGHKGYGLSVMIEMLGGALSGNHPSSAPGYQAGNGAVLLALDAGFFVSQEDFATDVSSCAHAIRNCPPIVAGFPVLLPGDVENQQRERRQAAIPVADAVWRQLAQLAKRLGTVTEPHD
jgi:LDH2 family malate/lactate/ureidoglycolate dehydrogenase